MFKWKVRSVFDTLLPKENLKKKNKEKTDAKSYIPRESTETRKIWKVGVIDKRIRRLMNIIKNPKKTIKRHYKKMRKRYSEHMNNQKEETMKVIHDLLDVPMSLVSSKEKRSCKRKRKILGTMEIKPKRF